MTFNKTIKGILALGIAASINLPLTISHGKEYGEICNERWTELVEVTQKSVDDYNKGIELISYNPEGAFDKFNSSSSTAHTYHGHHMDTYIDCKNYIDKDAEKIAKEADENLWDLHYRASCGMKLSSSMKIYNQVSNLNETFNDLVTKHEDSMSGIKAIILPRVKEIILQSNRGIKEFNTSINSHYCEDYGSHIKYGRDRISELDDMKDHYQNIEKNIEEILEADN